ncbi:MAG: zf-HC2 domain-containing protein, partial [Acidimicrobiales bacterium]
MGRSPHERARWEAAFAELDPLERAAFWRLEVQGEHPRHAGAALGLPAADAARLAAAARSRVRATLVSRHLAGETDERCALVCEQLDGLLSGRLARRVEAALADHLDGCGRCRRLCHELAHAPAELAAALEARAPEGRTGRADPPNRPVLEVTVVRAHGPRLPRQVVAAAAAVVVLAAAALAGWVGVLRDLSPGGAGGELASPPIESGPAALPPPPTARASASIAPASGPVFSTPSIAAPEASAAAPAEAPVEPAPAVSPPAVSPPPAPEDLLANAAPAVAPAPVRAAAAAPSTGAPSAAAPSTTAPPAPEASIL